MKFIDDTRIRLNETVLIFKNDRPNGLGMIVGGRKTTLNVYIESMNDTLSFDLVRSPYSNNGWAYINGVNRLCLYFLKAPPFFFHAEDE